MTALMKNTLDKFLAENTLTSIDRHTYLVCGLEDKDRKITVCLVFVRDWHIDAIADGEYRQTIVEDKGVVFTLPAYWLCVPKELVFPYLTYLIDNYYSEELGVDMNTNTPNDSTTSNTNGCICYPQQSLTGFNNCPVLNS